MASILLLLNNGAMLTLTQAVDYTEGDGAEVKVMIPSPDGQRFSYMFTG